MPVPALLYWTLPIGIGVGAGIVAAIIVNRDEVQECLENATLSALNVITEKLENRKAERKAKGKSKVPVREGSSLYNTESVTTSVMYDLNSEKQSELRKRADDENESKAGSDNPSSSTSSFVDISEPISPTLSN